MSESSVVPYVIDACPPEEYYYYTPIIVDAAPGEASSYEDVDSYSGELVTVVIADAEEVVPNEEGYPLDWSDSTVTDGVAYEPSYTMAGAFPVSESEPSKPLQTSVSINSDNDTLAELIRSLQQYRSQLEHLKNGDPCSEMDQSCYYDTHADVPHAQLEHPGEEEPQYVKWNFVTTDEGEKWAYGSKEDGKIDWFKME